jgi:hypothetical protein
MWFAVVLSVATLLTLYLGWRLIEPSSMGRKQKIVAWLIVGGLLFGQRLTRFLHREGIEGALFNSMNWVGYVFLGLVSIVVVLMLVRDIPLCIRAIMSGLNKLFVKRSKRPYFIEPNLERRRFLLNASNAVILAVSLPLAGYSMLLARSKPLIVHNTLPISDLPEGLDGFTIAQISDTHIGPTLRGDWMRMVVDEVNALGADMIVHTGDLVDGSVADLNGAIRPIADLNAPHGTWMCTGNHEYYSGVKQWLKEAQRLKMLPLVNEHALIDTGKGTILLAGVSDYRGSRLEPSHVSSPADAIRNAPDHDVSILLAHQPRSVFDASKAGFDVQLSGHTHGGQYFPWTLAIHLFQPYVRGLHLHDNTLIYVNVGTGYWGPPFRLGTSPEITLHTLKRS